MSEKKRSFGKKRKSHSSKYSEDDLEKIRERAHMTWERKGKPHNTALSDWLEAEEELKEEGLI
ncbi:MAG: DUF2934 domain-containing protein [Candidatus Omnitrophica bacterium]|nr:DUF2934 domain-containing protein [Candidatus Omnitrophota bacterium]